MVCRCDSGALNADCSKCLGRELEKTPANLGLHYRDYRSEQTCPCTRGRLPQVWWGLVFPSPSQNGSTQAGAQQGRGMLWPREGAAASRQVHGAVLRAGLAPGASASAPQNTSPLPTPSPGTPRIWASGMPVRVRMMLLMLFVFGNFLKLSDLD